MTQYHLKADLLIQKVASEMVLLEPDSGNYFTLNPVAAKMVELLQDGNDLSQIAKLISDEYDVSESEALEDAEELMQQLVKEQLAEVTDH